jgi:hypothetical protein
VAKAGTPTMHTGESKGGRAADANWRCECHSIEHTLKPINTALSAKLLDISKAIMASAGGPTMHP